MSAADKLDNARATYDDFSRLGDAVWSRFNKDAGREGALWLYCALIDAYVGGPPDERRGPIVQELRRVVDLLEHRSP